MIRVSLRRLIAGVLFTSVASFAFGGSPGAGRSSDSAQLAAAQPADASNPAPTDRSQWRRLQRRMSKDDVKKLLGEPTTVSVSRFYEAWNYQRGTVIFDGKGRLDSWSEF
jgi:hypothetical protein